MDETEPAACLGLFRCNGQKTGECSHADAFKAHLQHLRAKKIPLNIVEQSALSIYESGLRTAVLPFCAHPEKLKEALKEADNM